MIAKLTGVIDNIGLNTIILDVNGVGYILSASSRTLSRIGSKGDTTSLLTHLQVREDDMSLFGFADSQEKDWFQILCKVQGVGARVALSILSILPPEKLPMVIASGDKNAIKQADGVGPKLAVRIITELKDKAGDFLSANDSGADSIIVNAEINKVVANNNINSDAISALINLGYGRADAFSIVSKIVKENGEDIDLSSLIKKSLKELSV